MISKIKNKNDNIAIALGGGVARGAFHLGVLDFCEQHQIDIKAYSGSSIGSIISASHASGVKAKEQLKIFSSNELKESIKFNYFRSGLLKIDPTNKIVNELLPIKNIEDIPKPLWISAYDVKKRELHYFNQGDTLSLCMGSSALIPVFKPISYKDMLLIDGGLFDNLPIKPLENQGYEIYAVDLFAKEHKHKESKKRFNPISFFKKNIFKQLHSNYKYSMENTHQYLGTHHIKNFSLFTFSELEDCFKLGFKEAQKHFLDILK